MELIIGMGPPRGEEGKVRVPEIRFQKSEVEEMRLWGPKIKRFGIIIREISYFQNQRLFRSKFGENKEHYELICKIKLLNLIKTQITS